MANLNIIIIIAAFLFAVVAIYALYAIIMFQGNKVGKDNELQLTTKNILEQVEVLYEKGEYALIQLLATKYLERVPNHPKVRFYLAQAYYKDRKYNNAIKQCLTILKKDHNNIDTKKLLGDCFIQKDMINKAIKEYEEIFDYRSNDKEVVRTLAELYKNSEQFFSAISVYNILAGLLEQNDEIADVQLILAELNERTRDYPAAFEAYKTRLGIYPTDVFTNQKLAELYIKIKNYPKSVETLLYMLSFVTEPKMLLWVYENLIQLYVDTEEYEKAIEYSNRLLDIQGSDKFKIKNDIANFNLKLNNYDTGITILEELVMMSQNGYDVTVELSKAYIERKEYQKALDKYLALLDKSTQKEAKSVRQLICELYILWAVELAKIEDFETSYKYLDNAGDYNPLNPEIYYNKALNKIAQRDTAASVELLHKALEYDKTNEYHTKYLLKLSEAHHILGNFFEEKKALSDLLKIDDRHPMGLYRSGLMYAAQHDTKNAEECFKKALQYDPELIKAKYNLALIYESNNRDKAKELYIEVLEQDPSFEEAKNALADLATSDYY
ncbi:MAG: tetratricopeptide repeat protein [Candidatus Gastranaerophilales bacterium]|nr:tetratricopeptide repeat protein [Candidatus Gastranaerophilales bacterium]MCM1072857.1 tetratricopeptide repeat protein [Bacteroides sp.]